MQAHPDIGASFDALMGPGHGTPDPDVLIAGDWDAVRTVVDVGGGTGAVSERVTMAGQSFFDPLPAGADLYLLKSVLGDWPDREAIAILKRCAEAAPAAGRTVILSGVSPDDESGPSPALLMMVLVGGRERRLAEFRQLARAAGLNDGVAARQASGRFVVECQRQAV